MVEFFKQWAINIVALVLFIVLFEILLPSGKMKKYVNLVTGTILIFAILSPIVGVLGKNLDITALETSNSNALDKIQMEKDSKMLEDEQMKQVVSVYRQKIINQLEQNALEIDGVKSVKADIIFNENYQSETFGEIRRVYLEIETGDAGGEKGDAVQTSPGAIRPVSRISPVKIGDTTKKRKQPDEKLDTHVQKKLEERIQKVFGVETDNIIISQMKR